MKRVLLLISLMFVSFVSSAQLVSSSSLIVTKRAFPEIAPGWRSNVELGYKMGLDDYSFAGISYSLGYRFSKSFYLGVLAGFDYALDTEKSTIAPDTKLSPSDLNFPVCLDVRYYFPIDRVLPFVEVNAGARLAPPKSATFGTNEVEYATSGVIINPKLGVAYRVTEITDAYATVGFCLQSRAKVETVNGNHIGFSNPFYSNISINLGVSF